MGCNKRTVGQRVRVISMLIRKHLDDHCASVRELKRLTGMHGRVIGYIYHSEGNVYQRDIEQRFDFKRSTATKLLQLLEKKEFISREAMDSDKRLKRIKLTPKAIALSEKLEAEFAIADSEIDGLLSPEELETFLALCDKLVAGLNGGKNEE